LAGNLPGVLLWLAVLPLAALGQADYAMAYTFTTLAGKAGTPGTNDGTGTNARFYRLMLSPQGFDGMKRKGLTENTRRATNMRHAWLVNNILMAHEKHH
jgi:hypothetical protein